MIIKQQLEKKKETFNDTEHNKNKKKQNKKRSEKKPHTLQRKNNPRCEI